MSSHRNDSASKPVLGLLFSLFVFFILCGGIAYEVIGSARHDPVCRHSQPLQIFLINGTVSEFNPAAVSYANWFLQLMFANHQPPYKVIVRQSSAMVYYKNPENVVSCTSVDPMFIGSRRQRLERLMFSVNGCGGDQPIIPEDVLAEVDKDMEDGWIEFVLQMNLNVKYWNKEWYFLYELNVECDGLAMVFDRASGVGTMSGNISTCSVRMPKRKSICL